MGEKTIPDEASPSLDDSQVSVYHNQCVVDSLSRSSIERMSQYKNTTISSVSHLSHRLHLHKEVSRVFMAPQRPFLWFQIAHALY